ncbi:MAG TPA: hypothetical protein VIJ11_10350 [Galbitalea sp.]
MNRQSWRGAALPETALTLTLLLLVIIGGIRVAVVGYEQVSVDGAAFFNAHETGLKQTNPSVAQQLDPNAATASAFPRAAGADATIAPQTFAPPAVSLPNYGFDQTNNRHGGASLMQPLQTISTVTKTNLDPVSIFGGSVMTVTGIGVEPSFKETGVHGNIGGNDFGTAASFASAADYFSQGENTPPYFGGFNYIQFCAVAPDPNTSWNGCPQQVEFLALGTAEYLDIDNWGRSQNGITPEQQAVFWETLYHQNVYAEITQALPSAIGGKGSPSLKIAQSVLNRTDSSQYIWKVYSWDSQQQGGFPAPGYVPGQYPLTPGANAP